MRRARRPRPPAVRPAGRPVRDWAAYLDRFHDERAGITEDLLSRCVGPEERNPYDWLAQGVDVAGPVVDVGCGSGPMASRARRWVGVDLSVGELRRAHDQQRGPLVSGSSTALPVGDGRAAAVVAAMSLMVVDDARATLDEAARVLPPGGQLAVLLPARSPMSVADRARYVALLVALGRAAPPFPHAEVSHRLSERLGAAGFTVVDDEAVRFAYPVDSAGDADLLMRSLYLPGVSERRIRLASVMARRWGGSTIGIPLRRVLAVRDPGRRGAASVG